MNKLIAIVLSFLSMNVFAQTYDRYATGGYGQQVNQISTQQVQPQYNYNNGTPYEGRDVWQERLEQRRQWIAQQEALRRQQQYYNQTRVLVNVNAGGYPQQVVYPQPQPVYYPQNDCGCQQQQYQQPQPVIIQPVPVPVQQVPVQMVPVQREDNGVAVGMVAGLVIGSMLNHHHRH